MFELQNGKIKFDGGFRIGCSQIIIQKGCDNLTVFLHYILLFFFIFDIRKGFYITGQLTRKIYGRILNIKYFIGFVRLKRLDLWER